MATYVSDEKVNLLQVVPEKVMEGAITIGDLLYEGVYFGNKEKARKQVELMLGFFGKNDELLDSVDHFAILRTVCHMAMRYSGVPLSSVHKLTQDFRARALKLTKREDFLQLSLEFVDIACSQVLYFRTNRYSPMIVQAIGMILSNFNRPLQVKEIAETFNMHPNHLSSQFKKETGMSVTAYLQDIRLEYALRLLRISALSLSDISLEVGFYDQSHFTRVFRAKHGMTPLEYRKQHNLEY